MYTSFGQIPTNGGYRHDRGGVLGQVPQNGHYSSRRTGVFGQLPVAIYASPPVINDGGLMRIDPSTFGAFQWSMDSTTNTDPKAGATMKQIGPNTYHLGVVSGPGDNWLSAYMDAGYVVLFSPPTVEQIGPSLNFYATTDPQFVASSAAYVNDEMIVIGGNETVIQAAKALATGAAPPGEECPAGTTGVPPFCLPTTPGVLPALPETGCPPGHVGIPPFCLPVPGGTPPGPQPPGPIVEPPPPPIVEPPPVLPPAEQPPAVAKTGAPKWLLPVLIGVGALSAIVILMPKKKTTG